MITSLEMQQQADLEGVSLTAIRLRVQRTGKLEKTPEPAKHADGKVYYTAAQIKQKALEDGVSVTAIKQRIRANGNMNGKKPLEKDRSLHEYIAARDGVSLATIHKRIRKYGDPEVTHSRGITPSPEVMADAEFMLAQGVEVRIIAAKYGYTPRQMIKWLRLSLNEDIRTHELVKRNPRGPKARGRPKEVPRKTGSGRPKGRKDSTPRKKRGDHPSEAARKEKISLTKKIKCATDPEYKEKVLSGIKRDRWLKECADKRFARRARRRREKKARKLIEKFRPKPPELD